MRWLGALVGFALLLPTANVSATAGAGTLRVVTYNVAGLPEGISESHPVANLPVIGERLNRYDLALVQEDFAYAKALRTKLRLPFQSRPFERGDSYDFGDGLSVFSRFPFTEPERTAWRRCNGFTGDYFDCLTPKGFTRTKLELGDGAALDVYDVHLDAGYSDGDRTARTAQLDQLGAAILRYSSGNAVLVGGDFNLSADERNELEHFSETTGLADACFTLRCPDTARIDRVLFRSSPTVLVKAVRWRVAGGFLDAKGAPLSDHAPVAVDFEWKRRGDARLR